MKVYINDPVSLIGCVNTLQRFIAEHGENEEKKDALYEREDGLHTYVKKVKSGYSVSQWRVL